MEYDLKPPVEADAVDDVDDYRTAGKTVEPKEVFPESVASGDPSPRGAILWTRISPSAYREDAPLIVELAEDDAFSTGHQYRIVEAEEVSPRHDYTVKVDLDDSELSLESDRRYWYRFEYDGATSRTGRFRTLPDSDTTPESVRFAVVTCQNYLNGYFGAYRHVADEDVDFLLDLGDFIYEYAGDSRYEGRSIELPSGNDVACDLEDYRHLYRAYHSDRSLQEALERHTRIQSWDDHEFANDIYWDYDADAPMAPDHPFNDDPERMRRLVRDALKAWWEYTPARMEYDDRADHIHEVIETYRSFRFGDLLTLIVTDERLYKTQPSSSCADTRLPDWLPICYVSMDPGETMLGEAQREWFLDEVRGSTTTWTAWANEVLTLPARVGVGPLSIAPSKQAWDGYESERERIMYEIKHGNVGNFVTLTGDMHSYLAGYQRLDYPSLIQHLLTKPDPDVEQSRRAGVELMTPAITSVNVAEKFSDLVEEKYGITGGRLGDTVRRAIGSASGRLFTSGAHALMPHIEFFDGRDWGYSVVEFTRDGCYHRAYGVDKTADPRNAEKDLINAVRVPSGEVEIEGLSESTP